MKEKKRSNTKSKEQKEKVTQNLSSYLPNAWLRFLYKTGSIAVYSPQFQIEDFILFVRTEIVNLSDKQIVNDIGEKGLKFLGNP